MTEYSADLALLSAPGSGISAGRHRGRGPGTASETKTSSERAGG
jgi:hypothetical protein